MHTARGGAQTLCPDAPMGTCRMRMHTFVPGKTGTHIYINEGSSLQDFRLFWFVFTCCKVVRRICMQSFNDQREGALGKGEETR